MKTVIRKYDKHRIALLPTKGLPEEFARWMVQFAKTRDWKDFKIVKTQDEFKQLGIVCKPRQWLKMIRYFRKQGEQFPPNYEDEFMNHCLQVLTEATDHIERRDYLTKEEEETVKDLKEKALEKEFSPEELEEPVWEKEEEKKDNKTGLILPNES